MDGEGKEGARGLMLKIGGIETRLEDTVVKKEEVRNLEGLMEEYEKGMVELRRVVDANRLGEMVRRQEEQSRNRDGSGIVEG